MKKIFLSLAAMMVAVSMSAQYVNIHKSENVDSILDPDSVAFVFTEAGTQTVEVFKGLNSDKTRKSIYIEEDVDSVTFAIHYLPTGNAVMKDGKRQKWFQLWAGGPCWAEFNVGNTLTSWGDAGTATFDNFAKTGGWYSWGDSKDRGFNQDSIHHFLEGDLDTATKLWGENWRMPTPDEFQGLIDNCDWVWCDGTTSTFCDGCQLTGYKVTGRGAFAETSIFLPASGYYDGMGWQAGGMFAMYWSSTSNIDPVYNPNPNANALYFMVPSPQANIGFYSSFRKYGYPVRPVLKK